MHRRTFLRTLGSSLPAAAVAAPAQNGAGAIPIKLGYDTYSIRAFRWKALQHIEYAASLKLDTVQLSSLDDFESLEPAHLAKVKDAATRARLTLDGGIASICPTTKSWRPREGTPEEYIMRGLRVSQALGAKAMRCFIGSLPERNDADRHIAATIKVLKNVRSRALDTGVKIAIENHNGDVHAKEVRAIIEESGKDFVGSNLDTGNPMWLLEDPLLTLETLAPYVVTTHIRDSAVWETPGGIAFQWVALGDGTIDLKQLTQRFRELCPQAAMQLEIITGRPPQVMKCYSDPDFWKSYPKLTGAEFARFAALAKCGQPFAKPMVITGPEKQPPAYDEALKLQQRLDLERSFEYAKKTMNVGVNWRA